LFIQKFSSILLLRLAFQSLGVVFGDLGTSPLYVFYNIFPHGFDEEEDLIGALSLIIYTITLIPLMKYVFVVLQANDNGQGEMLLSCKVYTNVLSFLYVEIFFQLCMPLSRKRFALNVWKSISNGLAAIL
jgi:K+ transporter